MKKKNYFRFQFGLGLLAMAAMILLIAPAQSWGGGVACSYECSSLPNDFVKIDDTLDSDGDGFRDLFECCAASSSTYWDGSLIASDDFDPNVPDLFVVVTEGDGMLRPENVLEYVSNEPTWLRVHEIEESKVGDIYNSNLPEYRRVSPGSLQRAVRLHLSGTIEDGSCPIPADLKIGIGNVGTTMDLNAGGTVFTRQIERKVRCLYVEAGLVPPDQFEEPEEGWPSAMQTHIDTYIKHTAAHELFHNLHLRYLLVPGDKADVREYNKYEYHYSDRDQTIMSQKVVGSVSKDVVNLPIGTEFMDADKQDSINHMTFLPPPPQ